MPPKPTAIQTQLKNITTCLTITANTLDMLVNNLHVPFLTAISNMTQSLLKCIQVTPSLNLVVHNEPHSVIPDR
jgi:Na+-transporting NADH:ubiquinone oxidoreductase subunit NqrD